MPVLVGFVWFVSKFVSKNFMEGYLWRLGGRFYETSYVSFVTGWMVYPYGKIALTTPYGGMKNEIIK